jgi:hypothetical protein
MKNIWKWVVFGLVVFLAAFLIALPLFAGGWMPTARTVYGFGMLRGGMMDWGWGGIGWIGLLFRSALPILAVVGGIALVYWLVKRSPGAAQAPAPAPTTPCAYCSQPLSPGWVACPYCGKKVKK